MAKVLTGISGNLISAASAGFAPTNSADVSAIASAYQVVSATATQLYAGTAYVTSVNDAPLSAARAGNAVNATQATSAWYDGTGRLISSLPDSAAVSAIASAYAESAASSKQDTLTFGYDDNDKISSINGSSLAGEGGGGGLVTAIGTSESGITSINNSGLVDTAALRSADYSSLYVQEPLYISASGDSSYIGISGTQVNADWAETASAAPSYIENKPDLVDIVAGPGIVIDNPDGNTLRVSVAQDVNTVLWTGSMWDSNRSANLAEPASNFEYVMLYGYAHEASSRGCAQVFPVSGNSYASLNCGNLWYSDYLCYNANSTVLNLSGHNHAWVNGSTVSTGTDGLVITKIVGCARTASEQ